MSTDTPAGAGSATEIDTDGIHAIASQTRGALVDILTSGTTDFTNTVVPAGSVGTLAVSSAYAGQVAAAKDVFEATIQGVVSDLEAFADNLDYSARAHSDNDDAAAAALAAMNVEYTDQTVYASTEAYDEARTDEALQVSEEAQEAADEASQTEAAPAAEGSAPTTTSSPGADAYGGAQP